MVRGIFVGTGLAAALAGAVASGVMFGDERKNHLAPDASLAAGTEEGCIESNVQLVEGMARRCLTSAQYEALRDQPVIGGDGQAVELNLASDDSDRDAGAVRTCGEYDARVQDGWYAMTGADMRREEYFKRACVSLSLLARATPARSSNFDGGHANAADIRSMAKSGMTGIGENAIAATMELKEIDAGVWRLSDDANATMIYEIAHADFTGDGLGEILAYVSVGATGGTARAGAVGLIEKPSADSPCAFSAR